MYGSLLVASVSEILFTSLMGHSVYTSAKAMVMHVSAVVLTCIIILDFQDSCPA